MFRTCSECKFCIRHNEKMEAILVRYIFGLSSWEFPHLLAESTQHTWLDCFMLYSLGQAPVEDIITTVRIKLLHDVLVPRRATSSFTGLDQWQYQSWFLATLVPLKVQKSGGFFESRILPFLFSVISLSDVCIVSVFSYLKNVIMHPRNCDPRLICMVKEKRIKTQVFLIKLRHSHTNY